MCVRNSTHIIFYSDLCKNYPMKNIFSKFLTKPTRTKITFGNTNEFGGLIAPTKPLGIVNEPVEFTSTVDFTNAQVQGIGLPYKVYSALVLFNGVNGWPVVTVLQNTLGFTPTWTKETEGSGIYYVNATAGFPQNKTMVFHGNVQGLQTSFKARQVFKVDSSGNLITLFNVDIESVDNNAFENIIIDTPMSVEIRVYP